MSWNRVFFAFALIGFASLGAQTISEKKAELSGMGKSDTPELGPQLEEIRVDLKERKTDLINLYTELAELHRQTPLDQEEINRLLEQVDKIKEEIRGLENEWRQIASDATTEDFALWHQPDTTVGQLVIDYGSLDYVYLMRPEIAAVSLTLASNLPIPRSAWNEMLSVILEQSGIGIRQLTPFLRELYFIDQESHISLITSDQADLAFLPPNARVCFVLSPDPSDIKRIWLFFDKFVNTKTTRLQLVGRDLYIVGDVEQIQELLKLYDFAASHSGGKEFKVLPLTRVDPDEMSNVLQMIFQQFAETTQSVEKGEGTQKSKVEELLVTTVGGLQIIPLTKLANAIFLVGTKEEIEKAEAIIRDVEDRVALARERIVYTYVVKHSDPEKLAEILSRIYSLMVETGTGYDEAELEGDRVSQQNRQHADADVDVKFSGITPPPFYNGGSYAGQGYVVNPPLAGISAQLPPTANQGRNNFIVDLATGTIVMVIEVDLQPKLLSILKTLDIPKKMVQIEVLLFEKRLRRETNYGLKFLRTGNKASNTNNESIAFNNVNPFGGTGPIAENSGLFQFCISRMASSGIPAYDLAYNFLISQEDVQINSAPSVLTQNQTPAIVTIRDEFSIKTATFTTPSSGGAAVLEESFTRKQYGITVQVTPIIHTLGQEQGGHFCMGSDGNEVPYVTLDSIITFELPQSRSDQPVVDQREVKNVVSIPDGQTVIMGGLRRKVSSTSKDAIPYIGELPGIGKLFSWNELSTEDTDMYIFLTPKIIYDPVEDLKRIRRQELCKRPGDIPDYLCRLTWARKAKSEELLQGTMTILFGPEPDRCICTEGEYDGRSCRRCR